MVITTPGQCNINMRATGCYGKNGSRELTMVSGEIITHGPKCLYEFYCLANIGTQSHRVLEQSAKLSARY